MSVGPRQAHGKSGQMLDSQEAGGCSCSGLHSCWLLRPALPTHAQQTEVHCYIQPAQIDDLLLAVMPHRVHPAEQPLWQLIGQLLGFGARAVFSSQHPEGAAGCKQGSLHVQGCPAAWRRHYHVDGWRAPLGLVALAGKRPPPEGRESHQTQATYQQVEPC